MRFKMRRPTAVLLAVIGYLMAPPGTGAEEPPYVQGPTACEECHEAEASVWKGSKHSKGYSAFHKQAKSKALAKMVGNSKKPKRNKLCSKCHYTMTKKSATDKPRARAGPSCESCHGPSSVWDEVHSEFGPYKDADHEPAAQRAKRLAESARAGMIHAAMHYDIAMNCMGCHGLARGDVSPEPLAQLLSAGHPVKPEFELVRYSQGSVRHRFYRPDVSVNQEMTEAEASRFFVVGHAAKLVSASAALARASDGAYKAVQQQRIDDAARALSALSGIPQAQALLASPTEANARLLAEAIASEDLTREVGSLLPPKGSYK